MSRKADLSDEAARTHAETALRAEVGSFAQARAKEAAQEHEHLSGSRQPGQRATLRISRGAVQPAMIVGREVHVDGVMVGRLTDRDDDEFEVDSGTHLLMLRLGVYASAALRFVAHPGKLTRVEVTSADAGVSGILQGGWLVLHETSTRQVPFQASS